MKNYTITRQRDGAQFEIVKNGDTATIYSVYTWSRGRTCQFFGLALPEELPTFTSFIKAIAYTKNNLESLY